MSQSLATFDAVTGRDITGFRYRRTCGYQYLAICYTLFTIQRRRRHDTHLTNQKRPLVHSWISSEAVPFTTLLDALLQGLLIDNVGGSSEPIDTRVRRPKLKRVSSVSLRSSFHDIRTYNNVHRGRHCLFIDNVGGSTLPIETFIGPVLQKGCHRD